MSDAASPICHARRRVRCGHRNVRRSGCRRDGRRSTAVAVQVLITTSNPSVFVPQNTAVAVNGGCNGCGAFAYARQYVLQTDGPAHLSGEGRQEVEQLRQEISDAAASILP